MAAMDKTCERGNTSGKDLEQPGGICEGGNTSGEDLKQPGGICE